MDFILICIISVLLSDVHAAGMTLDLLRKTECRNGTYLCPQDGSCCTIRQTCSSRARTCVDVFPIDMDPADICCSVFNKTYTDHKEGVDEVCRKLYGTINGQEQACPSGIQSRTAVPIHDGEKFSYEDEFITMTVIAGILGLLLLIYCCKSNKKLRRTIKRYFPSYNGNGFRGPSTKETDQNKANKQKLLQAEQQNLTQDLNHAGRDPPTAGNPPTAGDRYWPRSGETAAYTDTAQQQQTERLATASPTPNQGPVQDGLVQRETVPEGSSRDSEPEFVHLGHERAQFNRHIGMDQTQPHDVQPIIVTSMKKYNE